ncbi:MAG: DUF1566 domain-containing protein [Gammaproteobacteria bacterium]|nr:DUF1566 domain-containing protein [Gammaproteobacteria bacterium]
MLKIIITILLLSFNSTLLADCVRNIPGEYIDRFTDNRDGTVTDEMTKLIWMRCNIGLTWSQLNQTCEYVLDEQLRAVHPNFSWQDALLQAQNANLTSALFASDWRLPNIKEIASLSNIACVDPSSTANDVAIDSSVFPLPAAIYWSSTPVRLKIGTSVTTPKAWQMNYKAGSLRAEASDITTHNAIRLVRGISQ